MGAVYPTRSTYYIQLAVGLVVLGRICTIQTLHKHHITSGKDVDDPTVDHRLSTRELFSGKTFQCAYHVLDVLSVLPGACALFFPEGLTI